MVSENPTGSEEPNSKFLSDVRRIGSKPIDKQLLPETSSQEIGWFTKVQTNCTFRQDPRVNHPRSYSDISQYMDTGMTVFVFCISTVHQRKLKFVNIFFFQFGYIIHLQKQGITLKTSKNGRT